MTLKYIVYSSNGTTLCISDELKCTKDFMLNYHGLLSMIEPVTEKESKFLYSLELGKYHIDVCFNHNRYHMLVLPNNVSAGVISYSSLFVYFLGEAYNNLIMDLNDEMVSLEYVNSKFEKICPDNLEEVKFIFNSLLTTSIEYVSFIGNANRVLLSIGESSLDVEKFIQTWCSVLQTFPDGEDNYAQVSGYDNIAVFYWNDIVKVVVYFSIPIQQYHLSDFEVVLSDLNQKLINIFKE